MYAFYLLVQVGQANRKDVRNAVEVAKKSQPGWEKRSGFNRSQILFYIAENLELRAQEFAAKLEEMGTKVGLHFSCIQCICNLMFQNGQVAINKTLDTNIFIWPTLMAFHVT